MNTEFSTFDIYLPRQLHSTCEICDLFYDSTTYLPYWFSCFYEMSVPPNFSSLNTYQGRVLTMGGGAIFASDCNKVGFGPSDM